MNLGILFFGGFSRFGWVSVVRHLASRPGQLPLTMLRPRRPRIVPRGVVPSVKPRLPVTGAAIRRARRASSARTRPGCRPVICPASIVLVVTREPIAQLSQGESRCHEDCSIAARPSSRAAWRG